MTSEEFNEQRKKFWREVRELEVEAKENSRAAWRFILLAFTSATGLACYGWTGFVLAPLWLLMLWGTM